jgi:hypothetical protein
MHVWAFAMTYDHTQRGYFHWLLYVLALTEGVIAWLIRGLPPEFVSWLLGGVAALFFVLGLAFQQLRVYDGGDRLELRFGPLPLLRGSIRYDAITSVEPGRSALIDGWGIHWIPGRGYTYNLWGFDCVVVRQGRKTIRVGTDDVDGLLAFLRTKVQR